MFFWWCTYTLLLVLSFAILDIDFFVHATLNPSSLQQPKILCHDQEKIALLHFKQEFSINCSLSSSPFAYPKVNSWHDSVHVANGSSRNDCCSWDGVKCDEQSGHIVGLDLSGSCLYGPFPPNSTLFSLDHLLELNLAQNHFNYSQIPLAIGQLVKLTSLDLSHAAFSGLIPVEISKISKLSILDLSHNYDLHVMNLEKLVSNFTGLTQLHLDHVDIRSVVPLNLSNQTSLKAITLRSCHLHGDFPTGILRLPNLEEVSLDYNKRLHGHLPEFQPSSPLKYLSLQGTLFSDELPTSIGNIGTLSVLNLNSCKFSGSIPSSLGNLTELTILALDQNHFSGNLPSSIVNLTRLTTLTLSDVMYVRPAMLKSWLPQLKKLTKLVLSNMSLRIEILPAVTNLTKLTYLALQDNLLIGQVTDHMFANLTHLTTLDLSHNLLRGRLPIPPSSVQLYKVNGNQFYGVIPKQICYASSLIYLDLSDNFLYGKIPSCIVSDPLGGSLRALNIANNSIGGTIPEILSRSFKLQSINLSRNQLEGKLPKSLARCTMLQVLDVGGNHINGTFPSWLENHPKLAALILSYNNFQGKIPTPVTGHAFHCLRIFDLSHNYHTGELPSNYLRNWLAMKVSYSDIYKDDPSNLEVQLLKSFCALPLLEFDYSFNVRFKGREYSFNQRIVHTLREIDFSNNKFSGRIPEFIGNDFGIRSLNLSNNQLCGCIPSSLANLPDLEVLDLSRNMLSGIIPQELTQLESLVMFNVSYNHLVGPIPQGNQFDTFDDSSYWGNKALCGAHLHHPCGAPVSHSCKKVNSLPPSEEVKEGHTKLVNKIIISCVVGSVIGFVLGKFYVTDTHLAWFFEKFRKRKGANARV